MSAVLLMLSVLLSLPLQQEPAGPGDDIALKLVQRIQQDLSEVDRLLEQASDAAELTDELAQARGAHVRAIADLEELIRQIKYQRGGQSSSSGGGGGSGSSSQPSPREADDRGGAGSASTPNEGQKTGQEPQGRDQGGRTPQDSAQPDDGTGAQRDAATAPPPDALDDFLRRDTDARWGVLPPKMQERLMNLHLDDVPARYRTWLDAYVRELRRRESPTGGP